MSVIMLLGVTGLSKNVDDTQIINLKLYHDFIIKLFTLCVVKCSPRIIYISVTSLCQPLHQLLIIKIEKIPKRRGFIRYLRCL